MESLQQPVNTFMPMMMQSMMAMGQAFSSIPVVGPPMQDMMFFMMQNVMHPMMTAMMGMLGIEVPPFPG
jgi:hypothetical protein